MKKKLSKIVSLSLCAVMLISMLSILSSAMSVNQGIDALRSQWTRGNGPKKSGYSIDYSCYSPKKSNSDSTQNIRFAYFFPVQERVRTREKSLSPTTSRSGRPTNIKAAFRTQAARTS